MKTSFTVTLVAEGEDMSPYRLGCLLHTAGWDVQQVRPQSTGSDVILILDKRVTAELKVPIDHEHEHGSTVSDPEDGVPSSSADRHDSLASPSADRHCSAFPHVCDGQCGSREC